MRPVQPLLRLTFLLVAAAQGQARVAHAESDDAASPRLAPRYDFSRYFGGSGADPGGGLGLGLGAKAAASSSQEKDSGAGFVDPVDFKSFFGGTGLSGQQKKQPFFGASSQSGSQLPFGSFGSLAAASSDEQDDFADFKSKRGAGLGAAGSSSRTRDAASADDEDFFAFNFPEGGGDKAADLHDEDADDKDEADEDDRPAGYSSGQQHHRPQPLKQAGNARYPSYSSYYHTQPEQLRAAAGAAAAAAAEDQDDDYGFDEDDGPAGLEDERGSGSGARGSGTAASSAEAYDSRPFQDGSSTGRGAGAGGGLTAGSSYSSPTGPARFNLQGGFVPSPVDPLRTQATAANAAHASSAASHAAVHAAVKAAHRAASKHGKPGAGASAGAALALGAADHPGAGLGFGASRPFNVRRTREEPDDAFFESFNDDRESDDYKFSPEHFEEEDEGEGHGQRAAEAEGDDGGPQSAAASAGRCKKVVKKGAVCMVCADPKTGGNYEQCQYATEPETQSYSFGRSSSYGNPRPASRRRREDTRGRQQQEQDSTQQDSVQQDSQEQQDKAAQKEAVDGEGGIDAFGEALTDSHEKDHAQIEKELDSSLEQLQGPKYEDYFSFLFPELSKEKNQEKTKDEKSGASKKKSKGKKSKGKKSKKKKNKKVQAEEESEDVSSLLSPLEDDEDDPFAAETTSGSGSGLADLGKSGAADLWLGPPESVGPPGARLQGVGVVPKKDLERMLGEFQQKDRSDCTKVEKDKMTCYQCVDKKGMQHEECMFVAASEPKQSHLAYHQSSAFKAPGPPPAPAAKGKSTNPTTTTPAPAPTQRPAASNAALKTAPAPAPASKGGAKSRQQRAAEQAKDDDQDDDDEKDDLQDADDEGDDEPEGPKGLGQGPDDGMFVEETKPVFDRALRMSLPKYMLERSEHERVFDEALAAGV